MRRLGLLALATLAGCASSHEPSVPSVAIELSIPLRAGLALVRRGGEAFLIVASGPDGSSDSNGPVRIIAQQREEGGAFVPVDPPRELIPDQAGVVINGLAVVQGDADADDELYVHASYPSGAGEDALSRLWSIDSTDWSVRTLVDVIVAETGGTVSFPLHPIDEASVLVNVGTAEPHAGGFAYIVSASWAASRTEPCSEVACLPVLRSGGEPWQPLDAVVGRVDEELVVLSLDIRSIDHHTSVRELVRRSCAESSRGFDCGAPSSPLGEIDRVGRGGAVGRVRADGFIYVSHADELRYVDQTQALPPTPVPGTASLARLDDAGAIVVQIRGADGRYSARYSVRDGRLEPIGSPTRLSRIPEVVYRVAAVERVAIVAIADGAREARLVHW